MKTTRSQELFEEARRVLVGGVNSPVRSFRSVGGSPRFIAKGQGSRIWDEDGNEYIDYIQSWGAAILGHAPPPVVKAVREAAAEGFSFGTPTEKEVRLAQVLRERMPAAERVRLVSSGTEAAMSALRVARAHTRRSRFIKFEGGYHGHADAFLSKAGSGLATFGISDSAGVPAHVAADAITLAYNDLDAVKKAFSENSGEVAAIIVEPVAANMGVVPPEPGFLPGLRELCDQNDSLLVLDEVITGFRIARGGAQQHYNLRPDLLCLGKILGGGLPLAAYAGREDLMQLVAPEGPVYQAGTLSGNPLAVSAGLATLKALTSAVYENLEARSAQLTRGLEASLADANVEGTVNQVGSLLSVFFTSGRVRDFVSARSDIGRFQNVFHQMLASGVHLPPSPYEAWFVGTAHTTRDIETTVSAFSRALTASVKTAEVVA